VRVFKFGGASIKDATGVKNVAEVLKKIGYQDVFLVVSAMGKMTNAFEKLTHAYFYSTNELPKLLNTVRHYYYRIIDDLFTNKKHKIYTETELLFDEMAQFITTNRSKKYNFVYDQLVSYGELFSTKIVSQYLNEINIENT